MPKGWGSLQSCPKNIPDILREVEVAFVNILILCHGLRKFWRKSNYVPGWCYIRRRLRRPEQQLCNYHPKIIISIKHVLANLANHPKIIVSINDDLANLHDRDALGDFHWHQWGVWHRLLQLRRFPNLNLFAGLQIFFKLKIVDTPLLSAGSAEHKDLFLKLFLCPLLQRFLAIFTSWYFNLFFLWCLPYIWTGKTAFLLCLPYAFRDDLWWHALRRGSWKRCLPG